MTHFAANPWRGCLYRATGDHWKRSGEKIPFNLRKGNLAPLCFLGNSERLLGRITMRRFGSVLNGVVAISLLLVAFAVLGGLDWLAERSASAPVTGLQSDAAKAEPLSMPAPRAVAPEPAAEAAAAFVLPPETSLAQATPAPEEPAESTVARSDLPPLTQAPETAIIDSASQSQQAMVRVAATAAQISHAQPRAYSSAGRKVCPGQGSV